MAKHVGSLDIRKDLRVRGRIEDNLRVRDEVEASAFYVRGVGEVAVALGDNGFQTATSTSNTVSTVESNTTVSVTVPPTGNFAIKVEGVMQTIATANGGGPSDGIIDAEIEEKVDAGSFSTVRSSRTGLSVNGNDSMIFNWAPSIIYGREFGSVTNGSTYTYRLTATFTTAGGGTASLNASATLDRRHVIKLTLISV